MTIFLLQSRKFISQETQEIFYSCSSNKSIYLRIISNYIKMIISLDFLMKFMKQFLFY